MATVVIARVFLRNVYFQRQPSPEQAPRWGRYFALTSLVNGLLWGSAGVMFFVPEVAALQVLLYTGVIGIATGSLIGAAFLPSGFYAFAVPASTAAHCTNPYPPGAWMPPTAPRA